MKDQMMKSSFFPLSKYQLPLALLLFASVSAAHATTIRGVVTNGTTHKPSAGDAVVLVSLQQRMQESARTTTDSRGRYSIDVPDSGMHLIRVDHQKAAYFQPAPPDKTTIDVEVFDVAAAVPGVSTEANVMRVDTNQQGLEVTQSIFVKNASNPPRTQFSSRSYEIYLPPDAQIEGSAAMGPGGMPVRSSPMPLGDKGHYAFLFPIRPGETQFQLTYHLPYSGSLSIAPRLATAAANFVVMLPKSMTFKPKEGVSYQPIDEQPGVQTFLIRDVSPSQSLDFTVSGSGAFPRDTEAAGGQAEGGSAPEGMAAQSSPSADNRPGGGLGEPIDTPDPLNKYKWWILGGIALALAVAAAFLLRKPIDSADSAIASSAVAAAGQSASSKNSLLAALKEELFAIETERVQGKLAEPEYIQLKAALELVLRRALTRRPA